jgi:uncharacterized protein YbcI
MDGESMNNVPLGHGETAAAISTGIVSLLRDYTGRGPTKARTAMNRDTITVILTDGLTKAERKLADNGRTQYVLDARHQIQRIMSDDCIEMVETVTGRKVLAFMSGNHIDPDMAAEVFVLEPLVAPAA